jgi:endogenous inhibitor of DNA gyrase (YacG/DUF329 family)
MNCPICKRPVPVPDADHKVKSSYPFCSERCKLIDLGRWLDGKYQIPVVEEGDPNSHEGTAKPRREAEDGDA